MKSKHLTITAAIVFVVIIVVVLLSSDKDNNNQQDKTLSEERSAGSSNEVPESKSAAPNHSSSTQLSAPITKVWVDQINSLLGDDAVTVEQSAVGMLKIVANESAPLAARHGALEHALNLTQDKDFNIILNTIDPEKKELPAALVKTILDNTFNRPHTIQVAAALKIIQGKHSDIKEEAIELLEFHTDQDHGDNINAWKKSVADFIKQQNAIQDKNTPDKLPIDDVEGE